MNGAAWLILTLIAGAFALPAVVYLCVKLGTLGWLAAMKRSKDEENDNYNRKGRP